MLVYKYNIYIRDGVRYVVDYADSEGESDKSYNLESGQNEVMQEEYDEADQPYDGLIPKGYIKRAKDGNTLQEDKVVIKLRACISCRLILSEEQVRRDNIVLRERVWELFAFANGRRPQEDAGLYECKFFWFNIGDESQTIMGCKVQQLIKRDSWMLCDNCSGSIARF